MGSFNCFEIEMLSEWSERNFTDTLDSPLSVVSNWLEFGVTKVIFLRYP
jgi:hypothetical protein